MNCPKCGEELKGYIEVDTEAELPTIRRNERKDSDYNYKYYAFKDVCRDTQQDMIDAGWVKPKENRG